MAKTEIKDRLEARLLARLADPECTDSTLKIALDYLKVFKVDDTADEAFAFRVPKKGILKQFADRLPEGAA